MRRLLQIIKSHSVVQLSILQVNRFDICIVLLLNWICERCKSWPGGWNSLIAWRRPTTRLNDPYCKWTDLTFVLFCYLIGFAGAVSHDCIIKIMWSHDAWHHASLTLSDLFLSILIAYMAIFQDWCHYMHCFSIISIGDLCVCCWLAMHNFRYMPPIWLFSSERFFLQF